MLVGESGLLLPHVFASLVAFAAAARQLAVAVDVFTRARWDAEREPLTARARARARLCEAPSPRSWLCELRTRSGIGGALVVAHDGDGEERVRFTLSSCVHKRASLIIGRPQSRPTADCATRVLEVTVHASAWGWNSVGVVALAAPPNAWTWNPDCRLAVRPLRGVAWVATSGALLRLDHANDPSRVISNVRTRPWAGASASNNWALRGDPLPLPCRLRLEVVPCARSLRVRHNDDAWSAPIPLGGLIDGGWAFAATLYRGASLSFALQHTP